MSINIITEKIGCDKRMRKNSKIKLTLFMAILSLQVSSSSFHTSSLYKHISKVLRKETNAYVYLRGSPYYEKRRKVKNGLCKYIFPDMVVAPKSSEDVSIIVKTARKFNVPISVRSGGHSFLCQSIKPGRNKKSNQHVLIGLCYAVGSFAFYFMSNKHSFSWNPN